MVNRRSFFHGAFVLMAASLVTRIMGFVYRIFLTRLIGASGVGLFQIVFPILSLVLTFVTAGLPTAMSKLVAEAVVNDDKIRVQRILRVSSTVILSMAVVFTAVMWFARGFVLHHWLTDARAYPSYLAMIPVVSVIAVSSIFRGYFQGLQDMAPTAWASIVEQTVRIGSIWLLAAYFIRYSLAYAAAAAMMGMVLGELAGLLILLTHYRRKTRLNMIFPRAPLRSPESTRGTLRAIGDIAVPVTLSRLVGSLLWAIEPILVTKSLIRASLSTVTATMLYGEYSGMAMPLLFFPTVFTSSLAVNLVPSVSEAIAGSERHRIRIRMTQSWRATAIVGFPTSIILTLFATPLCRVIFHAPTVGTILAIMAPAGFLLYLQAPLSGILQGMNRAGLAMFYSIIGGIARLGLIYVLASQAKYGILGVAYATTISICLTTALSFYGVQKLIGSTIRVADTAKIAIASLVMLVLMDVLTPSGVPISGGKLLGSITAGLLLYFSLLCSFRVITSQTMVRIPRFGKFLSILVALFPFAI